MARLHPQEGVRGKAGPPRRGKTVAGRLECIRRPHFRAARVGWVTCRCRDKSLAARRPRRAKRSVRRRKEKEKRKQKERKKREAAGGTERAERSPIRRSTRGFVSSPEGGDDSHFAAGGKRAGARARARRLGRGLGITSTCLPCFAHGAFSFFKNRLQSLLPLPLETRPPRRSPRSVGRDGPSAGSLERTHGRDSAAATSAHRSRGTGRF